MSQPQDSGSSQRPFCRGPGCSFYGDAVTGFCSVCAKKNNIEQPKPTKDLSSSSSSSASSSASPSATSAPIPIGGSSLYKPPASAPVPIRGASTPVDDLSVSPSAGSLGTSPDKPGMLRCASCNKKLGLTGIKCRCDHYYCSNHRYSDQHNCTFDYKSKGRDELTKANPVIISPKVDKI